MKNYLKTFHNKQDYLFTMHNLDLNKRVVPKPTIGIYHSDVFVLEFYNDAKKINHLDTAIYIKHADYYIDNVLRTQGYHTDYYINLPAIKKQAMILEKRLEIDGWVEAISECQLCKDHLKTNLIDIYSYNQVDFKIEWEV